MTNMAKYIKIIKKYISNGMEDFTSVYLIGDKNTILRALKVYVKKNPEHVNEINYILNNFDELIKIELSLDELKKAFENKNKYRYVKYTNIVSDILFYDDEEALKIIKKKNYSLVELSTSIKLFSENYPLQVNEINRLNEIYNMLNVDRKKTSNTYVDKSALCGKSLFDKKTEMDNQLKELYLSNLSIEEFCSLNNVTIKSIKNLCDKYMEDNKKIIDEILNRDSSEFKNYIKNLGLSILEKEEFDRLDYYLYTKLKYEDFRDILYQLLPKEQVLLILKKLNKTRKITCGAYINKNKELEAINIINGKVISNEEKIKIFDFLEENNLPLDLYKTALKKYANGNLDLGRQKKKK